MITTEEAAYNEMRSTFLSTWTAGAASIVGVAVPVLYQGNVIAKPPADSSWCRISTQTVMTRQTALSDRNSKRRDETSGIVTVQVFVPLNKPDGDLLSRRLCTLAKKAFLRRSLSGTVLFRRARVVELDPDGTCHRRNVVAEFEYDELN